MEELLRQIIAAANGGAYYLALVGALIVPDMCGALEAPNGRATGSTYAAWFDANVAPYRGFLDGDTCYKFRCSLLHQGTTQHPGSKYTRILFAEPSGSGNVFHLNVLDDALNIDVRQFCHDVVTGALGWRERVQGTEPYETNVRSFVTRYADGLAPYFVGIPIIS